MLIKKILFRLYVSLLKKKWGMTANGANVCVRYLLKTI